ncbi:hypothetical protein BDW22DRAFT_1345398 [Trametopsis cervina]|nr:hypothetical protein BDW22DRAFT_1345398 [Trametopsis cervina]
MVLVGEKKYACETCIKGHRSSTCKHTDRPLYEIKKKGRPVTQCEHCRELRKTKQVHVKCMCGAKEQKEGQTEDSTAIAAVSSGPIGLFKKKGGKQVPETATFPSGLSETLGASAIVSEGSDSEAGSEQACLCDHTGACNCATPRVSKTKLRSKSRKVPRVEDESDGDTQPRMNQPAALVASAHGAGKRPVLPRPNRSSSDRASPPRSSHSPYGGTSTARTHPTAFSPYERAYDYAHGAEVGAELPPSLYPSTESQEPFVDSNPIPSVQHQAGDQAPQQEESADLSVLMAAWLASLQSSDPAAMPVTCDCGPNCACPGCVIHQNIPRHPSDTPSCVNPQTCSACMDCTMTTATEENAAALDQWFRRIAESGGTFSPLASPRMQLATPTIPNFALSPEQMQQFDPAMWQTYALWPNLQNQVPAAPPAEDATSTCCGGQCKCPEGACTCPDDCCGCCAGCACSDCTHMDRSMGTGKTLTFAVSGERAACCSGSARRAATATNMETNPQLLYGQDSQAGPSRATGGRLIPQLDPLQVGFNYDGQQLDLRGAYEEWPASGSSAGVPRVSLSRASSTSSRSSTGHRSPSSASQYHGSVSPVPSPSRPDSATVARGSSIITAGISYRTPVPNSATSAHSGSPLSPPFSSVDPTQDRQIFTDRRF